jgi:hypothetical protein
MSPLLAHHIEAHHVPVLVTLFAAGFFVGWQLLAWWLTRGQAGRRGDEGPAGGPAA